MIVTIALNPGIEKRIGIDTYKEGTVMPVDSYQLRIESSAIHSAYVMRLLQAEPYVLGFAGGIGGRYIKNFLDKNRIKSNLITKDQELRTTFVITNASGITTRLVDDEEAFTVNDGKNLKHKLVTQIDEAELIVLSGAVLHSASRDIILESTDLVKKAHKRLIMSLEGEEIRPFIEASPFALILDEGQVEGLTPEASGLEETLETLRQLAIGNHVHYIFFRSGNQVVGISRNKIAYGTVPGMNPEPLAWQKHALLGGLAIGIKRKYEFEKIIKLMTAVNFAISEQDYPILCKRKDVDVYLKKSKIVDYYRGGAYRIEEVQHGL